uniref:Col_cuticle_N domain-containing protein n=1 Tax=Steinernema glaseri TaxID=37863 RepID=A0A1I7ZG52_9BILA
MEQRNYRQHRDLFAAEAMAIRFGNRPHVMKRIKEMNNVPARRFVVTIPPAAVVGGTAVGSAVTSGITAAVIAYLVLRDSNIMETIEQICEGRMTTGPRPSSTSAIGPLSSTTAVASTTRPTRW